MGLKLSTPKLPNRGDQSWADPVIASLLDRSDDKSLEALTATAPSLALLVLQKTGGVFSDSTGGERLVWLLYHREDQCVPVKELRTSRSYMYEGTEEVVSGLLGHPLARPSLTSLPPPLISASSFRDKAVLIRRLALFPKLHYGIRLDSTEPSFVALLAASQVTGLVLSVDRSSVPAGPLPTRLRELKLLTYLDQSDLAPIFSIVPDSLPALAIEGPELKWQDLNPISRLTAIQSLSVLGFDLPPPEPGDEPIDVCETLSTLSTLTELYMKPYETIGPLQEPMTRSIGAFWPPSLRFLHIEGGVFNDQDLILLFSNNPSLEHLKLENCNFSSCSDGFILPAPLPSLRSLEISVDSDFIFGGAAQKSPPSSILNQLPSLETFKGSFDFFNFGSLLPSVKHIELKKTDEYSSFDSISTLTNLTHLSFSSHTLSDDKYVLSFLSFSPLRKLRTLSFHLSSTLSNRIIMRPSDFIAGLSGLTRLTSLRLFCPDDLYEESDPDANVLQKPIDFFSLVGSLSRLQVLHIGAQSLGSPSWQTLPARFPDLSELALYAGESPESVPVHVRQALSSLPSLRRLVLFHIKQDLSQELVCPNLKPFLLALNPKQRIDLVDSIPLIF